MESNRFTTITQAHGAGGSIMQHFLSAEILSRFSWGNATIGVKQLDDGAVIDDIVLSTDGHTVNPLFFPGGDIGSLAVAGTVNDVCVMGATPLALASAIILEEGIEAKLVIDVLESMNRTAQNANVPIIAGDTKVMEHGALDKMVITTTGIGKSNPFLQANLEAIRKVREYPYNWINDLGIEEGDDILVSGTLGDHGIAILSARGELGFKSSIQSDVAPLADLVEGILQIGGITAMKDPTRGGLNNTLNEWSLKNQLEIRINEQEIPISPGVRSACEMLGMDPLEIGNEGKLVVSCLPSYTETILKALQNHPLGHNAKKIGSVTGRGKEVILNTFVGGERILLPPVGDPIPRIC